MLQVVDEIRPNLRAVRNLMRRAHAGSEVRIESRRIRKRRAKIMKRALVVSFIVVMGAGVASAQITNSAHDFSNETWSNGTKRTCLILL